MTKDKKEVDYKEKAGTAWSHAYLNQKPWHPLSYPNQRRKWIAEQVHAQKEQRRADVAREFAQEQEFFRQTSQMSKKEKEKLEALQAVSFMYMRPPGYNAEAARAAELADERKKLGLPPAAGTSDTDANAVDEGVSGGGIKEKKKAREKDIFGRTLPTEQEFPALKNAPRHETGASTRVKPFAIEIRNVKCARCGAFGHQSGDRECPLKDTVMPNEEARLKREDPLNVILAQTASDEPVTWELKHKPGGLSPARGGFKPDHPNQQIIPDEDIFDEYGGFLPGGGEDAPLSMPNLLASLSHDLRKELTDVKSGKSKHKKERKRHKDSSRRKTGSGRDNNQHYYRHSDEEHTDSSNDDARRHRSRGKNREDSSDTGQRRRMSKGRHTSYSGDADQRSGHKREDEALVLDKDYLGRNRSRQKGKSRRRIDKMASENRRDAGVPSSSEDDHGLRRLGSKEHCAGRGHDHKRLKENRRGSTDYESQSRRKNRSEGKENEKGKKRRKQMADVERSNSSESNSSSSTRQ